MNLSPSIRWLLYSEWAYIPGYHQYESLPIDWTPTAPNVDRCYLRHSEGIHVCSRAIDHTGRHASGDGRRVLAVWNC